MTLSLNGPTILVLMFWFTYVLLMLFSIHEVKKILTMDYWYKELCRKAYFRCYFFKNVAQVQFTRILDSHTAN